MKVHHFCSDHGLQVFYHSRETHGSFCVTQKDMHCARKHAEAQSSVKIKHIEILGVKLDYLLLHIKNISKGKKNDQKQLRIFKTI